MRYLFQYLSVLISKSDSRRSLGTHLSGLQASALSVKPAEAAGGSVSGEAKGGGAEAVEG